MRARIVGLLVVVGCGGAQAEAPVAAGAPARADAGVRTEPDAGAKPRPSAGAGADSGADTTAEARADAGAGTVARADAGAARAEVRDGAHADADDAKKANAVALRLFRRALVTGKGNVMIAGTSVRDALAVAYLGARGDTAREMANTLELDPDPRDAAAALARDQKAWTDSRGKAQLFVATRLWVDGKQPLLPSFVEASNIALPRGGNAVESVDFRSSADAARATINAWVAERTNDKIRDLLGPGTVDARTRVVVTNAVYFKGAWAFPFPAGATKDEPFRVDGKRTVSTPLMHTTDTFRFAQEGGAKVLEMRYAETPLAMIVVLPDGALDRAEQALTPDALGRWTAELASRRVAVTLPRFSFASGGSMVAALRELGITRAFTDKADFSGIAPGPLSISEVAHRTWISVDEKGTEAAAATGVVMRTTSLDTSPVVEFKADRPFLFFLHDTRTRRVLFAGRVMDPTSKGM